MEGGRGCSRAEVRGRGGEREGVGADHDTVNETAVPSCHALAAHPWITAKYPGLAVAEVPLPL